MYEYDDASVVSSITQLTEAQDLAMQQYWFQEASWDQRESYRVKSVDGDMDAPEWTATRREVFNRADLNGDGQLNRDESREFLGKMRVLDRLNAVNNNVATEIDTHYERLNRHFTAAAVLSSPSDSMGFDDYVNVEKIMMAWYNADKLEKTGWVNGASDNTKLSHYCNSFDLDERDRIIAARLTTNPNGIEEISVQSVMNPQWTFPGSGAYRDNASFDYGFTSTNYVKFWEGRDIAGLWGYTNADGDLAGLGFVERDSNCAQEFLNELGASAYTWISPKPSQLVSPPPYPEEYKEQIEELQAQKDLLTQGILPEHEHSEKAETALVVITVLIWVAIIILMAVFAFQMCKQNKGGAAIHRE